MFRGSPRKTRAPEFEEAFHDDWSGDLKMAHVPLGSQPLFFLGLAIFLAAALVAGRVLYLSFSRGEAYRARAEANSNLVERLTAPRGLITDRNGETLAENKPVFLALLKSGEFIRRTDLRDQTLGVAERVLGMPRSDLLDMISNRDSERIGENILLSPDLTQSELIALKSENLPTIEITAGFKRRYPAGAAFSPILGYTGLASVEDLRKNPDLTGEDAVGKAGVEYSYENLLRGVPGSVVSRRDARGKFLGEKEKRDPQIGSALRLTIDAEFQKYFYDRLREGLALLGRNVGVGLAIRPETGEILALVDTPSYDNNIFTSSGNDDEKRRLLAAPDKPLFNRAVGGLYSPGSTIKPLVGLAALSEGVIGPDREIFSPGYLDVPNPYDPEKPTRFLDWRPQGSVNLERAIAQSSNVYFYEVGGGFGELKGLGISRLREWWRKFGLGTALGVDLPGESAGHLPDPDEREKRIGRPWLVGDTYNVSIGQGDLLITPLQLISYIGAIANGGTVYRPFVAQNGAGPKAVADLRGLEANFGEIKKGMIAASRYYLGTAYLLHDLPFVVAAKTGTAQIKNNEQENAFFVGFAPAENPQIAVLILVERSREGSLNTVPIARDVLNWYYINRISKNRPS